VRKINSNEVGRVDVDVKAGLQAGRIAKTRIAEQRLFFISTTYEPLVTIYMRRDKVENEDLITYVWLQDPWYHVDKLSYPTCVSPPALSRYPPGKLFSKHYLWIMRSSSKPTPYRRRIPNSYPSSSSSKLDSWTFQGNQRKDLTNKYIPRSN